MPLDIHGPRRRRGFFRSTFRGSGWLVSTPGQCVDVRGIRRGGHLIRDLASTVKAGPLPDHRLGLERDRRIDFTTTAVLSGMSEGQLAVHLLRRRRQTARNAYAAAALGCAFTLAWLWEAASSPFVGSRLLMTMDFLPFCVLFFVTAFYNALLNFQIRFRRAASWREYLSSSEAFWPS